MGKIVHLQFPGQKEKAFTLSYDDAVESDFRLADLMRKAGVKGTFNINTGIPRFAQDLEMTNISDANCRMNKTRFMQFYEAYKDMIEVAAHGLTHGYLTKMEQSAIAWEVLSDRKNIEELISLPCRGFAYPYGVLNERSVEALKVCGFHYARTIESTRNFSLPQDPLRWGCTCHHKDPRLMELAADFVNIPKEKDKGPYLFSVWGHSYEFNLNDNWGVMEDFLSFIGGRDDIWYCTNIEFFDYLRAWRSLEFFADQSAVYNPSAIPICLAVMVTRAQPLLRVTVDPGETIKLDYE